MDVREGEFNGGRAEAGEGGLHGGWEVGEMR